MAGAGGAGVRTNVAFQLNQQTNLGDIDITIKPLTISINLGILGSINIPIIPGASIDIPINQTVSSSTVGNSNDTGIGGIGGNGGLGGGGGSGGAGGSAAGGAIDVTQGGLTLTQSTLAGNTVLAGAGGRARSPARARPAARDCGSRSS